MSVLITDYISKPVIEKKILGHHLLENKSENYKNIKVLLVWHQKIDKLFLKNFPNLVAIVRYGVGYDQIDLNYCSSKKIIVCNTPDYGSHEVSDTALAMILNISRGISIYNHVAKKLNDSWQENFIKKLSRSNKIKIGIIGSGRIGSILINKLNHIGFKTLFFDPYVKEGYEKIINSHRCVNLKELIISSDIISLNCSLNDETRNIVNSEFLGLMKKGSSLINTARGGLIEDLGLVYHSLQKNHLFCLGFDVLPEEPPTNNELINTWRTESYISSRIIINPHTAFYSKDAFYEMRQKAATNALNIITKNIYTSRVN